MDNIQVYGGSEFDRKRRNDLAKQIERWLNDAVSRNEAVLAQSTRTICTQLQKGHCVLLMRDDNPIGYITTYYLATVGRGPFGLFARRAWWEVGTAIVPREFRGQGLGKILYQNVARLHPNGILVATTKNPVALHLSLVAGFKVEQFLVVPHKVRQGLCYTASCYKSYWSGVCQDENVSCVARVRWS